MWRKSGGKVVIQKQGTSTTTDDTTSTEEYSYEEETYTETQTQTQTETQTLTSTAQEKEVPFRTFHKIGYPTPRNGTLQDNMSIEDVKNKLENYIPLVTMEEKKMLQSLPLMRTWVKYVNTETRQFRVGGLLMKVQYPDYIMLVIPHRKITWSVQLSDNVLFVKDPKVVLEEKQQKLKAKLIKEKLYKLYLNGQLRAIEN